MTCDEFYAITQQGDEELYQTCSNDSYDTWSFNYAAFFFKSCVVILPVQFLMLCCIDKTSIFGTTHHKSAYSTGGGGGAVCGDQSVP